MPAANPLNDIEFLRVVLDARQASFDENMLARWRGPRSVSAVFREHRVRVLRDQLLYRPIQEPLDQFKVVLLKGILGRKWWQEQKQLHPNASHIVYRWIQALSSHFKVAEHSQSDPTLASIPPDGNLQALSCLAEDVYRLRLAGHLLPRHAVRLRNRNEFEGIRYELAIAASLVRSGFGIRWLGGGTSHCEFIATHHVTLEEVAVEAKARRRPGMLHETGAPQDPSTIRARVTRLYREALKKPHGNLPFLVCLDLNLPMKGGAPSAYAWLDDMKEMISEFRQSNQSEISKAVRPIPPVEILRLDISMSHVPAMDVCERIRQGGNRLDNPFKL